MMNQIKDFQLAWQNKKIAIDDVVTTYSSRKSSHKSSWTYLLKSQLEFLGFKVDVLDKTSNIHHYDIWLIALPMEFQGTYNLFGGATDEPASRIQRILDFTGEIYILNQKMPDVGMFVTSRMKSCSQQWSQLNAKKISARCADIQTIELKTQTGTFVLGDSHSISVYQVGADISRNDGKTLFGILKEGMDKYIPQNTQHLISYFGNIDIRHHICRQANSILAVEKLVKSYIDALNKIEIDQKTVHTLLPIEHEERKIPKTGWYKGTPFFGSREQRTQIMNHFNSMLIEMGAQNKIQVLQWPENWYTEKPEQYANQYMEKPGSVHLSRDFYYWDWETGEKNEIIKENLTKELKQEKFKIESLF